VTKFLAIFFLVFSTSTFASTQRVKQCQETCVDFEEPGYALKKCLSKCLKLIEEPADNKSYCNTYEDDCDRDGGDDDGPWFNG
jgi:hypothetical protein